MTYIGFFMAAALAAVPGAVTAASQRGPDSEQKICRNIQPTPSRIRGPALCMTQRDWDRMTDWAREDLSEFQGRPDPNGGRKARPPR